MYHRKYVFLSVLLPVQPSPDGGIFRVRRLKSRQKDGRVQFLSQRFPLPSFRPDSSVPFLTVISVDRRKAGLK